MYRLKIKIIILFKVLRILSALDVECGFEI